MKYKGGILLTRTEDAAGCVCTGVIAWRPLHRMAPLAQCNEVGVEYFKRHFLLPTSSFKLPIHCMAPLAQCNEVGVEYFKRHFKLPTSSFKLPNSHG